MLTTLERVLLLQNVDLFARVTSEHLSYLAAITAETVVPPGRVLYAEGDAPDGLYVVVSGSVLMRRTGEEIDRIAPNGAFGVWALFDDEPRLTTAEAAEESRLLFVPREDFYEVLSDHVEMVAALFKHLAQRLRRIAAVIER
ncbi:MAG TPA: Crp/Fnr family transcriptional regulator [Acidobacteriota bacterium]|nr:Crp/Fnr family transcriptional regulator [Acidobacteriota bacterium]